MAYQNQVIYNPENKQQITFIQTAAGTGGALLEMVSVWGAHSPQPPLHYHPFQSEEFYVTSGTLTVRIGNDIKVLQKGDCIHIPKHEPHAMWNSGNANAVARWKVTPALNTEYLFECASRIAMDNAQKQQSTSLLQKLRLAKDYRNSFRLAKPSYKLQSVIFFLITPFICNSNLHCKNYTD